MIKPFMDMYKVNTTKFQQKKPTYYKDRATGKMVQNPKRKWLDYIEWATILHLLYKHGADEVSYGVEKNEYGYPAFYDHEGKNPFVRVWVNIDGIEHKLDYPVMTIRKDVVTSHDIHSSTQRAFVKCVAINTGLGLSLWQKEEQSRIESTPAEVANEFKGKELKDDIIEGFNHLVTLSNGDVDVVHGLLGTSKRSLTVLVQKGTIVEKEEVLKRIKEELHKIMSK